MNITKTASFARTKKAVFVIAYYNFSFDSMKIYSSDSRIRHPIALVH